MKITENLIFDQDKTYFISDIHIGHQNIMNFEIGYHNFENIEDHDNTIVANWYSTVMEDDTVFFLGDASMPKVKIDYVLDIFSKLPGKIVWILGNHDQHIESKYISNFKSVANIIEVCNYKEIFVKCKEVTSLKYEHGYLRHISLFHYPIAEFNGKFRDSFHVYGHTHENVYPIKNAFPVAACLTGYTPVNYKWISEKISKHNEGLNRFGHPSIQPVKGEVRRD